MDIAFEEVASTESMTRALRIRRTVFIEGQDVPESIEVDHFDVVPAPVAGVAHGILCLEGQPVATGRLVPDSTEDGFAKVGRVAVLSDFRGRGFGKQMMRWLEAQAAELGYRGVRLSAQLHALGFYEELGYSPYGDIFLEASIEHRWMKMTFA